MNPDDPRFLAVVDMVRRTGAQTFELRYSDDQPPTVWMAIAAYNRDEKGIPHADGEPNGYDAGAGMDPYTAVCRLLDQLIDGGVCVHCNRPTGFSPDSTGMFLNDIICWYEYDPSTRKIVKGCAE